MVKCGFASWVHHWRILLPEDDVPNLTVLSTAWACNRNLYLTRHCSPCWSALWRHTVMHFLCPFKLPYSIHVLFVLDLCTKLINLQRCLLVPEMLVVPLCSCHIKTSSIVYLADFPWMYFMQGTCHIWQMIHLEIMNLPSCWLLLWQPRVTRVILYACHPL
jgi:hypothetical protein